MTATTYNSKKDTWLSILIYGAACSALAACVGLVSTGSPDDMLTAAFLLAIGVMLPVWVMRATYYVLHVEQLRIRCGPFRWTVPLDKIQSVERTRTIESGPALSLDRVRLRYGRFRWVVISPERREQFLTELESRRNRLPRGA